MARLCGLAALCLGVTLSLCFDAVAASPVLTFESPRGGEVFVFNQPQQIRLSSKLKQITLELSRDGGATFTALGSIDNTVKDKNLRNVLDFTVSGPASSQCVIRATSTGRTGPIVFTSKTFSIVATFNPLAASTINVQNLDTASVDARYVRKSGDTLSGALTLAADPSAPLHAATKQYVDIVAASSSSGLSTLQTSVESKVTNAGSTPSVASGLDANKPDIATVALGALYIATDSKTVYRSDGATWAPIVVSTFWSRGGNAGTNPSNDFLGTTDNAAFKIKVNNTQALSIKPATNPAVDAPNIVFGFNGNSITGVGGTIGGGGVDQGSNSITNDYGTIAGGLSHSISGAAGTVGGGESNTVSGAHSVVAGGKNNLASGSSSAIGGGQGNTATVQNSTVGGGSSNTASFANATVGGGSGNTASGASATVGGGISNLANGSVALISGGDSNTASGAVSTVGGGFSNTASGNFSTVPGGRANSALGDYSVVAGRRAKNSDNTHSGVFLFSDSNDFDFLSTAKNEFATRATGGVRFVTAIDGTGAPSKTLQISGSTSLDFNLDGTRVFRLKPSTSPSTYSPCVLLGFKGNYIPDGVEGATIGGGGADSNENGVTGFFGTVGGGGRNLASGDLSVIGGGVGNTASGTCASVIGGANNAAGGDNSAVLGGEFNIAAGNYSVAMGRRAENFNAAHSGVFLFADSNDFSFTSSASNEFAARTTGGVRFVTAIDGTGAATAGVRVDSGGTSWSTISDRNQKKNFKELDGESVLEKLAKLPVLKWNYRWEQDNDVPNIGPMAQDFKSSFYPGRSDTTISTLEFDGIEMAALKALETRTRHLQTENDVLKSMNETLTARIEKLERALNQK